MHVLYQTLKVIFFYCCPPNLSRLIQSAAQPAHFHPCDNQSQMTAAVNLQIDLNLFLANITHVVFQCICISSFWDQHKKLKMWNVRMVSRNLKRNPWPHQPFKKFVFLLLHRQQLKLHSSYSCSYNPDPEKLTTTVWFWPWLKPAGVYTSFCYCEEFQ